MNRPTYISFKDWDILNSKYSSTELEEYFNNNYPYQYLIGDVDFCDNKILVNENVLIPRFETEELVYKLVDIINKRNLKNLKVLDLCTGSGCIIISLAKMLSGEFTAVDVSDKALELAKENAKLNEVNIEFVNKDILKETISGDYDIIVSNPPYVKYDEEVGDSTKYEPQIALFANNEGLEFYSTIINNYNAKIFAFEIGCTQKDAVINIAKEKYPQANIYCEQDMSGLDRYIFIINE